jgi:uncharacterized protein (DUF2235 family)
MSRNLIVLSDGTGNSAASQNKTNVWRLYEPLDIADGTQLAVFGDGVGTSSITFWRWLGMIFGIGVQRNVLNLYKFLCRHWKNGDKIWAFGFSRGAFTIRVLIGLINQQGLVSRQTEDELDRNARAAYRAYREFAFPSKLPWVVAWRFFRGLVQKPLSGSVKPIEIHFVGLWDTVAAYGLPIDELTTAVDKWVVPLKFDDKILPLCANVSYARHALSLDDERRTFFPVLWDEPVLLDGLGVLPDRLQQVWFAGTHANVGENRGGIGIIGVPPPEEGRREIGRHATRQLEPGLPQLGLVTEPPCDPLRRRPGRHENDCEDNTD